MHGYVCMAVCRAVCVHKHVWEGEWLKVCVHACLAVCVHAGMDMRVVCVCICA